MSNTFKHRGKFGDLILGLPVVKKLGGIFYLQEYQHQVLGKLLDILPYIEEVVPLEESKWREVNVTHNLDRFRDSGAPSIARMYMDAFGYDLNYGDPWLYVRSRKEIAKIVVHDSGLYATTPGYTVNWNILKGREKDCVFIGSDGEHQNFIANRGINIPYYKTQTLYDAAEVIAGGQFFVGNQSAPYTIAEGLKVPLAIDIYYGKPQYPLSLPSYVNLTEEILNLHVK
jgi:hypothetical protein